MNLVKLERKQATEIYTTKKTKKNQDIKQSSHDNDVYISHWVSLNARNVPSKQQQQQQQQQPNFRYPSHPSLSSFPINNPFLLHPPTITIFMGKNQLNLN